MKKYHATETLRMIYNAMGQMIAEDRNELVPAPQAKAIVKELEEKYARKKSNKMYVAAVCAGLGDKDKAFEWLEKAFLTKEDLPLIRWYIPFDSLRDDPRYKDLLKRLNLPE